MTYIMLLYDILVVLFSAMTCSFGLTVNRSVALIPSTWNTAPSLETYRRTFDPTLDGRMQIPGMDKILRAADTKVSAELMEKIENQTREKKSTIENIDTETKLVDNATSTMRNNSSNSSEENTDAPIIAPRNVVLLLIDERDQEERKEGYPLMDYKDKLPFAIEGFLQSCRANIKIDGFPSDNNLISEIKEEDCDCERILRSKIDDLLSWARETKGMTTGAISGSNFSIPSFPRYEFDGSNKSDVKLESRRSKRDSNDAWQMVDLGDRTKSIPTLITTDPKTERGIKYDGAWDIFDVFTKIRMAFFRSLLESLGRNDGISDNEVSSRKSFPFKPTATNLIGNIIRELKSISTDKGYMLIATVPRSERAIAVDLLQREITPKDTLLVVMPICAEEKKSLSFVAQGPNSRILREARTIVELPIAIRKAIANSCHTPGCIRREKRNVPIISHRDTPTVSEKFAKQIRIVRNAAEKPKMSKLDNTNGKHNLNNEEITAIGKEKQARNPASLQTIRDLASTLGIAISIFALTSS